MGKNPFSFRRTILRRRNSKKSAAPGTSSVEVVRTPNNAPASTCAGGSVPASSSKAKKKIAGARLWMKFDRFGQSELIELDKGAIIKRVGIPARDLRILGPVFSQSSNIVAREWAMVVNLEFIKAIVTAEEALLLDPLRQEVLPFVDQLRQQLTRKDPATMNKTSPADAQDEEMHSSVAQWAHTSETVDGAQQELPFEFQVLEIALEVVCSYLDSNVGELEKDAYPVLDELAQNVSTKNLERVRSLKSNLTRLLARVQKVKTFYLEEVLSILKTPEKNHLNAAASSSCSNEDSKLSEDFRAALDEAIEMASSNEEFDPLLELISSEATPQVNAALAYSLVVF